MLRTLPAAKQRRLPLRLRLRIPVLAADPARRGLGGACSSSSLKEGVDRTQRGAGPGPHRGAAGRAHRVRQAHLRARLRPAGRPGGAPRGGAPRRRPGPRHEVDDRDVHERRAQQAARRARRRPLRRRRAARRRHRGGDPDAEARLAMELYAARARPPDGRRGRARCGRGSAAAPSRASASASTSSRRPCVPLLPRVDHAAAAGRGPRGDHAGDAVRAQQTADAGRAATRRSEARGRRARRGGARAPTPSSRSHTSGHGTPVAAHSFGKALVGVIPGSVLSSLTSTRPPSSTKKSTRARPAQPTRTNVSTASRRTVVRRRRSARPRGHPQLHPAVGVLRLEVVPAGALEQDDLARARRPRARRAPSPRTPPRGRPRTPRRSRGRRGRRPARARRRALPRPHLRDPDGGAEAGRLDEQRQPERGRARRAPRPGRSRQRASRTAR